MSADLQVIALTIPWPADYGGVIDIYYRLKALHAAGIKIDLHCFQYDRKTSETLEKICNNAYYYPRKTNFLEALSAEPYITSSRANAELVKNINATTSPVLMEGIHCTHMLYKNEIDSSRCFVRIHNIEHHYYHHLALAETNPFRKWYFQNASRKLERFEEVYGKATGLACISSTETSYYQNTFGNKAFHLPAFHPYNEVSSLTGKGEYVLYHGNLSIAENHKAAMFLLKEVAAYGDFPIIIAGKSPGRELILEAVRHSTVRVFANPNEEEMDQLLKHAQVHVLPSFQNTGVKLKLLAALFRGRFVVTNSAMVSGTGIAEACYQANDGISFLETINTLMQKEFTTALRDERSALLSQHFNNVENAELLKRKLGL
jgi:glycosyltransferase involved in cell wall biosynthesis